MLNRRPDESAIQHHRRLVYGKMVDKTLGDIDYSELAEYIYGKELSSDSVRKMMYGSCLTLQMMDACAEASCDADIMAELDAKYLEIRKERQKLFDQRREYNKVVSAHGRFEYITERLQDCANRLNETMGLIDFEHPEDADDDVEAVIVLNDWHYGLKTHNIWNDYDVDACIAGVHRVTHEAVQRIQLHRPSKLHVLVLGDMCHGAIHNSARVASEELVCDQIMHVSEILAQCIVALAQHVPSVEVHVTYGNHARTVQNKGDSIHRDNMERVIPWWLKQRLFGADNIFVADESDTEIISLTVAGYGVCASHGDLDSIHSSPKIFSAAFRRRFGIDVACVILGDKHHSEELEELGIRSMIAGSLCGTDDYANGKRLYSTPEQLMLFFKTCYGIDAVYHLKVRK